MKGFVAGNCNNNDAAHTKVGECAMFEGSPQGILIADKNASFPVEQEAFNTAIQAAIYAAPPGRITPIMSGIYVLAVSGGDLRTAQEGFGPEMPNGINSLREDYTIAEGGYCLYKQLSKLNKKQVRIFKIDQANIAYGTITEIGGVDKMRGYLATIGVSRRLNTGEQTGAIILSILYSTNFQNEDFNAQSISLTGTIEGLSGIVLKKTTAGKAKVVLACSGEDLTEEYGSDLAVATLYKNPTGGNPTSVAYAAGELTFTPAAKYRIVDAAALKVAGIEGYEGENDYTDLA
jgi:hypothetical protein